MVLRISRHDDGTGTPTLVVEGRLAGASTALLEEECAELLPTAERIVVDLAGVSIVDRSGIAVLSRLQRAGLVIRGCSELLATILEAEGIPIDRASSLDDRSVR
jgi:anti-anti-sigma regulatory factor